MSLDILSSWLLYYFHSFIVFSFTTFVYLYVTFFGFLSITEIDLIDSSFDYIIVGGGSAGAILASRLSENEQLKILLIEAGVDKPDLLNIPALGPLHQLSAFDWKYSTAPQKFSCFGLQNRSSKWPSGKVFGGTTHLNYMMYVKGHHKDFLTWKHPVTDEWNYDDILYYFKKSKEFVKTGKTLGGYDSNPRGSLLVREVSFSTSLSEAVLKAALELGYKINDLNDENATGFSKPQLNMYENGKRWTSDQYLKRSIGKRKNLKIIKGTVIDNILFKNKFEAYGVQYRAKGNVINIFAKQEVILSAGVIGSPKLLLLSGVGPRIALEEAKIPHKVDLPVGKNLQDHVTTGLDLIILNNPIFSLNDLTNVRSAFDYFVHGKGPYTSALCEAIGIIHSRLVNPRLDPPDLEFMVMMAGLSSDGGVYSRYTIGVTDEVWDDYFRPLIGKFVATILPVLLHPKSVGEVTLDPKNPEGYPNIDARYLENKEDVRTLIEGIKIVQKLTETEAMRDLGAKLNDNLFPGCKSFVFGSDDYWECYIRHLTLTSYHPVGTCKMGAIHENAVVDHRLRVHKTNRLRVVDASVIPTLPSGNTNAVVIMIAEKAADLIKEDFHNRFSKCKILEIFIRTKSC